MVTDRHHDRHGAFVGSTSREVDTVWTTEYCKVCGQAIDRRGLVTKFLGGLIIWGFIGVMVLMVLGLLVSFGTVGAQRLGLIHPETWTRGATVRFRNGCALRARPEGESEKVGFAPAGRDFAVLEVTNGWKRISVGDGVTGWAGCRE